MIDVPQELIEQIRCMTAAVNLMIQLSGLDEKQMYLPPGIDAGHWTRITKGEAHFPLNKLNDLCDLCGNEAALTWWAWSRGKGLVVLQTETERQLAEVQAKLEKAEERIRWHEDLVARRMA